MMRRYGSSHPPRRGSATSCSATSLKTNARPKRSQCACVAAAPATWFARHAWAHPFKDPPARLNALHGPSPGAYRWF